MIPLFVNRKPSREWMSIMVFLEHKEELNLPMLKRYLDDLDGRFIIDLTNLIKNAERYDAFLKAEDSKLKEEGIGDYKEYSMDMLEGL